VALDVPSCATPPTMSTCPFASNVAVAAKRTLRIVGLGGGGQAGAGGGWVAHAVRIVAVTAEARMITIALRFFIGSRRLRQTWNL
jgi:hypothetical protein